MSATQMRERDEAIARAEGAEAKLAAIRALVTGDVPFAVYAEDPEDYEGPAVEEVVRTADVLDLLGEQPSGVLLTPDEASACEWALDHLRVQHQYDALRSRDGSRVDLLELSEKLGGA